jgi:hypothetical protein
LLGRGEGDVLTPDTDFMTTYRQASISSEQREPPFPPIEKNVPENFENELMENQNPMS